MTKDIDTKRDDSLNREGERLYNELRADIERGFKRLPREFRNGYHNPVLSALLNLVGNTVLNIDCKDCRAIALDMIREELPKILQQAEQQAGSDSGHLQ